MLIENINIANYAAKYIALPTEALVALIFGILVIASAFFLHKVKLQEKYAIKVKVVSATLFLVTAALGILLFASGKKDASLHFKSLYINKQNAIAGIATAMNENSDYRLEAIDTVYAYDKTLFLKKDVKKAFYAGKNPDIHLFFGDLFYNGNNLTKKNQVKAASHFIFVADNLDGLTKNCENAKIVKKYLGKPGEAWTKTFAKQSGCN